jgi:transcriptional regulator of acetoin/glycerol metabolism
MPSANHQMPGNSQIEAGDWTMLCGPSNALVIVSTAATEAAVTSLLAHLRQPIVHWQPRALREPPKGSAGTLVIREVDALDSAQQRQLLEWLDGPDHVQVISVASCPLFPLVLCGGFDEGLYYRLNVVYVECASSPVSSAA